MSQHATHPPPKGNNARSAKDDAMSTQTGELLSLRGVHAHYGKSHILHGIDLAIGRGEVISLLGRNGAGRSTTMKSIMGLVDVTGGIHIEGRDITNKRPFEIARAGLVSCPRNARSSPT